MLKAPGNLKGIAAKSNRNAHRSASVWEMSGTEVQVARKKDPVSSEYSWTTVTIKVSAVKGGWTQGTFSHSFAGGSCYFPHFQLSCEAECGIKRSKHTCTREKYARPAHTSLQVGEQGLSWEPHQANNTHINVNSTNGPMLFLMSDWSGLKFAGWYIYIHSL